MKSEREGVSSQADKGKGKKTQLSPEFWATVKRIKDLQKKLEKSKEVTKETMDLQFTI